MIIVQESDYDWSHIIGVFPTMEIAYEYFRREGMKPQNCDWSETTDSYTTLTDIGTEAWCEYKKCSITDTTQLRGTGRRYCQSHYSIRLEEWEKEQKERKEREKEYERTRPEREAKEREEYNKFLSNIPMSGTAYPYLSLLSFTQNPCREENLNETTI